MNFIAGGGGIRGVCLWTSQFDVSIRPAIINTLLPATDLFFSYLLNVTSMNDEKYLSQKKFFDFRQEQEKLKKVTIPAIAKRIDDARQMGDLSENAEYHAAREEMSWAQSRLKELDHILSNAVLTDTTQTSGSVSLGSTVTVKMNGQTKDYQIVGAWEADPLHGKISNESPLGQAFLGKKIADKVPVTAPAGVLTYEIIDVR